MKTCMKEKIELQNKSVKKFNIIDDDVHFFLMYFIFIIVS